MTIMKAIPYRTHDHGNFNEEWSVHKKVSEWWYVTGYFKNDEGRMYSYQLTLVRPRVWGLTANVLMLALTDFSTEQHFYSQRTAFSNKDILIDSRSIRVGVDASITKRERGMHLVSNHKDFLLDLTLDYGKGACWHCDQGVLRMGVEEPRETTLYYSYTNMPTSGMMTLNGKTSLVNGKSWFDKQGGPYSIINRKTHWEWFSLRFFDDEEMMLFTFPQSDYQDGTYITGKGEASRLTRYTIKPLDFVTASDMKFSSGWTLDVPGLKDEHYTIRPLMKGQVNLAYFELLAGIYNSRDEQAGFCFVELLPGVYNKKFPMKMFARVG